MAREYPGSTAYEVAGKWLTVPTTFREDFVTVTTSPTLVLKKNPRRLTWVICNRSGGNVAIGFQPNLNFGNFLFLTANGGTVSAHVMEDGELVSAEVYAVAEAGSGVLYVLEVYTV